MIMMISWQDHTLTENKWFVWSKHHIVEISEDVTDSGRQATTNPQMTGETPEVRFDKRKPREDRQNHRCHRYHGSYRYHGCHR